MMNVPNKKVFLPTGFNPNVNGKNLTIF